MQCSTCGATLPDDAEYCSSCGKRLGESSPPAENAGEAPTLASLGWQGNAPVPPPPPSTPWLSAGEMPPPVIPPSPEGGEPYQGTGWIEFSSEQALAARPASAEAAYPSISPPPGMSNYSYSPSGAYPYPPGSLPPYFVPLGTPAPRSRGRVAAIITIVSLMVLLVIFGSVYVGVQIGQAHSGTNQTSVTPTASSTPDPNQLYQQVTSQSPTFVDPLTNAALSQWSVFEKPTYGCEIKSDGLHVHIKDTGHFSFCTSGRGQFSNFAFQVEMKMLSGDGGGFIFRSDTTAGNFYYFHVFPDGTYHLYIYQNNQSTTELKEGAISSFASGQGQKNTLTVIAQGSQIYLYVNRNFLTKVQDSTYTSGYVGVLADDHNGPAEVDYTNAILWTL